MELTLSQLLQMAADRIVRPIKRLWLTYRIHRHYINRDFFREQVRDNQMNLQWTDKQIALLESDRRRL